MNTFRVSSQQGVLLSLAALCIACNPAVAPRDASGVYTLRSVTGTVSPLESPVSGTIILSQNGAAERRVTYAAPAGNEEVALGTFRVVDSLVQFALRADSGRSPYVWHIVGTLDMTGGLRLTYPRAADGTIAELYARR